MFNNIGGKIKVLAIVFCVFGICLSVIWGLVLIVKGADYGEGGLIAMGFILTIVGSLVSWLTNFWAYGFGELIDKTTAVANNTEQLLRAQYYSNVNHGNPVQPQYQPQYQSQYQPQPQPEQYRPQLQPQPTLTSTFNRTAQPSAAQNTAQSTVQSTVQNTAQPPVDPEATQSVK